MKPFNEGKACDAVIRRLEAGLGCSRQKMRFPEQENHSAPVEVVCSIGGQLFAFEHTGIEPFDGHIQGQAQDWQELPTLKRKLGSILSRGEHIEIFVPAQCLAGVDSSTSKHIQNALFEFVATHATSLSARQFGAYNLAHEYQIPEVPFEFSLKKHFEFPSSQTASLTQWNSPGLEQDRTRRIKRGYDRKIPKLSYWKQCGARTILVLEENDISLTNTPAVWSSLKEVEAESDSEVRPDEIYLISSKNNDSWPLWALRIDGQGYLDLCKQDQCMTEVDPTTLMDITARQP